MAPTKTWSPDLRRTVKNSVSVSRTASPGLPLRLGDLVLSTMATLAVAYLLVAGNWAPGVWPAVVGFSVIALGPVVFRALHQRYPQRTLFDILATFWLLPSAIIGHASLGPLADSIRPGLLDGLLARADLQIFGEHPALFFERHAPPVLVEAFLLCYYSYYLWPVVLCVLLFAKYAKKDRRIVDEYVLAMSLLFAANFIFYLIVPAIGPRFFLAESFNGPLKGVWLTPYLESAMRGPGFMRDCFPSGHTAVTLAVMTYAFNHVRKLFWVMLPVGTGIIAATVVCRFHYAVDLMCAIPLLFACISTAAALTRARPRGVWVLRPEVPIRNPLRA